jgi:hypothetical protein
MTLQFLFAVLIPTSLAGIFGQGSAMRHIVLWNPIYLRPSRLKQAASNLFLTILANLDYSEAALPDHAHPVVLGAPLFP